MNRIPQKTSYTLEAGVVGCDMLTHTDMQAFILYEESIPDSNAERRALHSIVGALQRCTTLSSESRDTLVHKAKGYSAKLLKKSDQCRAICACSHLFWQTGPEVGPHSPSRTILESTTLGDQ